ncbi:MAG: HAMP domain-containing histidine kinase [Vicinamibacteria bacterium]|nr:HAMP domain-containing histidine kinase [Vicinamibacteria bacterium]
MILTLTLFGLVALEGVLLAVLAVTLRRAQSVQYGREASATRDLANLSLETQKARASAETANRLKDEFLGTLSHELRTPLTAIVGWAHLLKRGQLSPAETTRAVDTIIRNAAAQNQIIDELLDVSRIIAGKLEMGLQPVDVAAVVQEAIGTVSPAASAKGIHLELAHRSTDSVVTGDPERLRQAFWNLLSNAIKFTPRGGRVGIRVETNGQNVEVIVNDTGLGINPDFLPHIFERFTQDDSSSTRHSRGLGLGLSITRQLLELHGGSIAAQSPGVGKGSTFTARLPRSSAAASLGATLPLPESAPLPGFRVTLPEARPGLEA